MKLKINREVAIGLTALLVLLVILGGVAVRRFFHREAIVAMEEEKHGEEARSDRAEHALEWPSKPEIPTAAAIADGDRTPRSGDWEHRNDPAKELKKEVKAAAAESIHVVEDVLAKPEEKRERERNKIDPVPVPILTDGRYSPEAIPHEKDREFPAANSSSTVVRVGGPERADRLSRPPNRNVNELHPHPGERDYRDRGMGSDSLADTRQIVPRDGLGTGVPVDPEAARKLEKKQAAEERHVEERRAEESPIGERRPEERQIEERRAEETPDSRYGNESRFSRSPGFGPPSFGNAPMGDAARTYSAGRDGRMSENSLRPGDQFPGSLRAENRLREEGKYEVQPNDNYWTISEKIYGSGAYFRALAEQNRGKAARPDRLPPGLVISTPPVAQLEKDYPDLCPRPNRRETVRNRAAAIVTMTGTAGGGRTYIVQEGDTLSSIARNELGKVSRWAEIYQLNREMLGKDFDYLTPGMRLVLPIRESQSGERTTRRDDRESPPIR